MSKIIRKTFKFRLNPTKDQRKTMHNFADIKRALWNMAVATGKECLANDTYIPPLMVSSDAKANGVPNLYEWLVMTKQANIWLYNAPASILLSCVKYYRLAVEAGFDKSRPDMRLPEFHKKFKAIDSFTYHDGSQVRIDYQSKTVRLPKLGEVKVRYSRKIEGDIKTVTVIRKNKHWYVCFSCKSIVENTLHPSNTTVGIDRGVVTMAMLSDGKEYNLPSSIFKLEKKLSREQKNLARKVKGSKNRLKNLLRVRLIYEKIANIRKDSLQKISTEISKNHADIIMEKLEVKKMSKKQGKYKSKLNHGIVGQGWFMFQTMLGYKQHWRGGKVTLVDAYYTSQKCSSCGYVHPLNRISQAKFKCRRCNHTDNADYNAACNIHAAGHAVKDCGGIGRKTPYEAVTYFPSTQVPEVA